MIISKGLLSWGIKKEIKDGWGNTKYTIETDFWGNEKVYEGGGWSKSSQPAGSQKTDMFGTTSVYDKEGNKVSDDSGIFKNGLSREDYDKIDNSKYDNKVSLNNNTSGSYNSSGGYDYGGYYDGYTGGRSRTYSGYKSNWKKGLTWFLIIFFVFPILINIVFVGITALNYPEYSKQYETEIAQMNATEAALTPQTAIFEDSRPYQVVSDTQQDGSLNIHGKVCQRPPIKIGGLRLPGGRGGSPLPP